MMKKNKIFTAITLTAVIGAGVFFACKKDEMTSSFPKKKIQKKIDGDFTFLENPYPIEEYLSNPEDLDEETLDEQLYEIGLIAKQFFKNTNLNHYIIEKAISRANDCIDLRTFREWPSVAAREYPNEIIDELQTILESTQLKYISKNLEVYGQEEYYIPAIFVANIENADPHKMPIFSSGVYVNEDLPGMEEYEDYIVV